MTRSETLTEDDLRAVAGELSLEREDPAAAAAVARRAKERIEADERSARASGVMITPTFFINGRRYDGPWDESSLAVSLAVDSRLEAAIHPNIAVTRRRSRGNRAGLLATPGLRTHLIDARWIAIRLVACYLKAEERSPATRTGLPLRLFTLETSPRRTSANHSGEAVSMYRATWRPGEYPPAVSAPGLRPWRGAPSSPVAPHGILARVF